MPFNTIQDVSRTQSIIGRILSVGSIELYSAYDGKNLKIDDISSPKKVEDLIFENLRGTHLRTPVDYDNGYSNDFAPAEPGHYRRMEDLDDLTLVNAKEQKKMQREIRRQARRNKYRREHPKYGSQDGYDTKYGQGYNQQYAPDYDSGYYEGNSGYRQNSNRDMNYNPHYGKSHRGSGAIRESYRQNPDKYFADNYEEFHQNNLDARDNYENQSYGGSNYSAPRQGSSTRSYRPSQSYDNGYGRSREDYRSNDDYGSPDAYSRGNQNQNQEKPQSKGAVERIKSFNLFGNSNESEKDISDREFDEAIDQAMQNMEGSIKFQPNAQNDSLNYESYSPDGFEDDFDYSSPYQHNDHVRKPVYYEDNRQYEEMPPNEHARNSNYQSFDDYKHSNSRSSKPYNNSKRYEGRSGNYRNSSYNAHEGNYRAHNEYNPQRGGYRNSKPHNGSYRKSNHYKDGYRNSNHYEDNYGSSNHNQSGSYESGESADEKNPDDLFAKHSKKFRKH